MKFEIRLRTPISNFQFQVISGYHNVLRNGIYIIAGPNGSGKTTFAKGFMEEIQLPFLNADEITLLKALKKQFVE